MVEYNKESLLRRYRDLEKKTMTPEKKEECKDDWFAFYVGRKLSYWMTIPFLQTNITPNQVTLLSISVLVIGFGINCFACTKTLMIVSWLFYFLWNLLDGVDGNLARYKKQFSKLGNIYDTMGGYAAYALLFLGMGIGAWLHPGRLSVIPSGYFIILGALSSISCLFPRLVYQKIKASFADAGKIEQIRWNHSPMRVLERNITSITGGTMVFSLLAILFQALDFFTVFYAGLNGLKMIVSLYSIFRRMESNG